MPGTEVGVHPGGELQRSLAGNGLGSHQQTDGQRRDDNVRGEGVGETLREQRTRLSFSLH